MISNEILYYELIRREKSIFDFQELPVDVIKRLIVVEKTTTVLDWLVGKPKMVDLVGWKNILNKGYLPRALIAKVPHDLLVEYPKHSVRRYNKLSSELKQTFINNMTKCCSHEFEGEFINAVILEALDNNWFTAIVVLYNNEFVSRPILVNTIINHFFEKASFLIDSLSEFEIMEDILCDFAHHLKLMTREDYKDPDKVFAKKVELLILKQMKVLSTDKQCHLIDENDMLLHFSDVLSFNKKQINHLAYYHSALSSILKEDMFGEVARKNAIYASARAWMRNGYSLTDEEQLCIVQRDHSYLEDIGRYSIVTKKALVAGLNSILAINSPRYNYQSKINYVSIAGKLVKDEEVQFLLVRINPPSIRIIKKPYIATWKQVIKLDPKLITEPKGYPDNVQDELWAVMVEKDPSFIEDHPTHARFVSGEISIIEYHEFINTFIPFAPNVVLHVKTATDDMLLAAIEVDPSVLWNEALVDRQTPELTRASVLACAEVLLPCPDKSPCPVMKYHPDMDSKLDAVVDHEFRPSHIRRYQGELRVEIAKRNIKSIQYMEDITSYEALTLLPFAKTANQKNNLMRIVNA